MKTHHSISVHMYTYVKDKRINITRVLNCVTALLRVSVFLKRVGV